MNSIMSYFTILQCIFISRSARNEAHANQMPNGIQKGGKILCQKLQLTDTHGFVNVTKYYSIIILWYRMMRTRYILYSIAIL
jgi:hypothetical protein